jgi:hypothetical protein
MLTQQPQQPVDVLVIGAGIRGMRGLHPLAKIHSRNPME